MFVICHPSSNTRISSPAKLKNHLLFLEVFHIRGLNNFSTTIRKTPMPSRLLEPELLPEFECERRFGCESFSFFAPIEVGDNFVANVWTRGSLEEGDLYWKPEFANALQLKQVLKYAINLYENGASISVRDPRFAHLPWALKLQKSWSDEIFSREEIERILVDLSTIQN